AAFFGADRIGREALAVVDVVDLDALVFADARELEQAAVDRAGAFVMQFGVGDGGAVDLGFEEGQKHVGGPQAAGESASGLDSTRWRALLLSGEPVHRGPIQGSRALVLRGRRVGGYSAGV